MQEQMELGATTERTDQVGMVLKQMPALSLSRFACVERVDTAIHAPLVRHAPALRTGSESLITRGP